MDIEEGMQEITEALELTVDLLQRLVVRFGAAAVRDRAGEIITSLGWICRMLGGRARFH